MSQGPYSGRCMTCGHDHDNDRALSIAASFSSEIDEVRQALSQAYFLVTGRSPAFSETFGTKEALADIDDACRLLRESAKSANPSAAMPNLDGDWSPVSETLVHRLRDPIPPSALADMPERMAEALNVIGNEAADAIESLAGQFREIEYLMECGNNASRPAADESAKPVERRIVDHDMLGVPIYADEVHAIAPVASKEAGTLSDTRMMDWLCEHTVNVRLPLVYGSRDMFWASPTDDEGYHTPSNLREQIAKAQRDASKAEPTS